MFWKMDYFILACLCNFNCKGEEILTPLQMRAKLSSVSWDDFVMTKIKCNHQRSDYIIEGWIHVNLIALG